MDIILIVLLFSIGLLFLITIHEFGHFIFAKLFGVYCFEFSIGFGKKVVRRKKKYSETYFCIGVVPLGGYVAMYGEDDDESEKRNSKKKKAKESVNEETKKIPEAYSEFTVIARKQYKLFKKQNKLLKLETEKLSKNNFKFRDTVKFELLTNQGGVSKEDAIRKIAEANVCRALKIDRLIVEEDFYKVVDQKNLPTDRDLEHINRGKKLVIMSAGIAMNFIVGFLLYLVSFICFPHIAITSIMAPSSNLPEGETTTFITQLEDLNERAGENSRYILDGRYLVFENDIWEGNLRTTVGAGFGIVHDSENNVNVAVVPTNQFQFNDLSLDNQLYVVENKTNLYNFYEISASESIGEVSWEEFVNNNAQRVDENAKAKEFFTNLLDNKFNIKKENLTLVRNTRYQASKEGAKIDSVDLALPVIKAKLDKNLDSGFYIDENDCDTGELTGTLTMDTEKNLLSNTYLSFTSHERWLGAEAFKYAGEKWVDGTSLIFQTVGKLFIGQGWDSVGGPLAILTQSTTIFRNNPFSVYIQMWGLISVNLAVMNLLPIPGLDGWHILVTVCESVIRRKLPPAFKKWASRIGLIFVFGLMIVILGLDILRIFGVTI